MGSVYGIPSNSQMALFFAPGWATKRGCGGGDEVSYAAGFRFTEGFLTPLRVVHVLSSELATTSSCQLLRGLPR